MCYDLSLKHVIALKLASNGLFLPLELAHELGRTSREAGDGSKEEHLDTVLDAESLAQALEQLLRSVSSTTFALHWTSFLLFSGVVEELLRDNLICSLQVPCVEWALLHLLVSQCIRSVLWEVKRLDEEERIWELADDQEWNSKDNEESYLECLVALHFPILEGVLCDQLVDSKDVG